jgi:hypothetical protein
MVQEWQKTLSEEAQSSLGGMTYSLLSNKSGQGQMALVLRDLIWIRRVTIELLVQLR